MQIYIYHLTYFLICLSVSFFIRSVVHSKSIDTSEKHVASIYSSRNKPSNKPAWSRQQAELCLSTCSLILQPWRWRRYVPTKRPLTFNGLHGVIILENRLFEPQILIYSYFAVFFKLACFMLRQKLNHHISLITVVLNILTLPALIFIWSGINISAQIL
jgi:hypothetical protein